MNYSCWHTWKNDRTQKWLEIQDLSDQNRNVELLLLESDTNIVNTLNSSKFHYRCKTIFQQWIKNRLCRKDCRIVTSLTKLNIQPVFDEIDFAYAINVLPKASTFISIFNNRWKKFDCSTKRLQRPLLRSELRRYICSLWGQWSSRLLDRE